MQPKQRNLVARLLAVALLLLSIPYLEAEGSCQVCVDGIGMLEALCGDGSTIEFICDGSGEGCTFSGWC